MKCLSIENLRILGQIYLLNNNITLVYSLSNMNSKTISTRMHRRVYRRTEKLNKYFRVFVKIFCLLGFSLQSIEMFYQYFSYETRITIQVNEPSRLDLPGITLCFNLDLHPTLKNLEPWHFLTTTPNMTKQNENCKMFGRVIKNGKDQDNSPVNCRDITGVKVSTIFNNAKCFTYLTQLNISSIQSRKINQMSLDSNIMILFSNETLKQFYPGQIHCGGVKILLNSPYFIPTLRFSDSFDVCTGQTGFIRFTTLFIKSLEWPYKTSCTNYGLSMNSKSVSRRKCFQVSKW